MSATVIVNLRSHEWEAAYSLGLKRQALRVARGKQQPDVALLDRGGAWETRNALGAVAEYALARHYGKPVLQDWCENKSFSLEHHKIPCDVGANLHVRSTTLRHGRLVAHPYDPDGGVFVLARIDLDSRVVTFAGWTTGKVAKWPENWLATGAGFRHRPAFVVPNELLNPMCDVPTEAIWQ